MPGGARLFVNTQRFGIRRRLSIFLLSLPMWARINPAAAADASPKRLGWEELGNTDRIRIHQAAQAALALAPVSIVKTSSPLSPGNVNDYYSNGDYWWPNPASADGLPYVRRDGQSNPSNFNDHRLAVRTLRDAVAALAAAAVISGPGNKTQKYLEKMAQLLAVFFVHPNSRMNPHLQYAQAIPGVSQGRGIGIIDTLHLIEIPLAIEAVAGLPGWSAPISSAVQDWFRSYLQWMLSSANGQDEAKERNNHSVAYWLQVAVFARFTQDKVRMALAAEQFKRNFIGTQMALDGSFPEELKRTKPYAYSLFQLDNMAALCQVLSTPAENLWNFKLADGRSMEKGLAYLAPYIANKSQWPYAPDVQAWQYWPMRQSALLFGGNAFARGDLLQLWSRLQPDSSDDEVQRNIAITQPILWLKTQATGV